MKVLYVSLGSPHDKSSWSGTPYYTLQALSRRNWDVHVFDTPLLDRLISTVSRAGLVKMGSLPAREPLVGWCYGALMRAHCAKLQPDVIIAVNADHKVAAVAAEWPTIVFTDGFFGPIIDYYKKYENLSARVRRCGDRQQRQIIASDASIIFSSEWAARTAGEYYGAPRSRFLVEPMGPNFDEAPARGDPDSGGERLELLFVGYDWVRKGGAIILDAFARLRTQFPDAQLHIVGATPPEARGLPGVNLHGKLNKADPKHAALLEDLYRTASFYFMPSRQECSAIVYCEASAFGLPQVGADTGGTSTIIEHGVSGLVLPYDAVGEDYARAIAATWTDKARWRAMRRGARTAYETRLNWDAWAEAVEIEARRLVSSRRKAAPGRPAQPSLAARPAA